MVHDLREEYGRLSCWWS